jgi:hypothetical protein
MFEDDIAALKKFNRLLQSTENVYLDILSEALPFVVSSFPGGEMALKVYKSLSKLQNSQIKAFLLETGNQDVRTAMKIITNDLDEKNLVYELIQALTLLKRGRDTFLHLIDQEYKKWDWLRRIHLIRDTYAKAFIASNFIAFCYKLLGDDTKSNRALNESKLYFYYRLYHYSEEAREKINTQLTNSVEFVISGPRIRVATSGIDSKGVRERKSKEAKEAVIAYYRELQLEEQNFIKMIESVFRKTLTKKLGSNSFRTVADSEGTGSRHSSYIYYRLYTRWEPPVTHW